MSKTLAELRKRKNRAAAQNPPTPAAPPIEVHAPGGPVHVDLRPIADAMAGINQTMAQLLDAQVEITQRLQQTAEALTELAGRDIPAPVVKMPPAEKRARVYEVEIDGVDRMRIEAK